MKRKLSVKLAIFLTFLGLLDASYLTYEHFFAENSFCPFNNIWMDCGRVLGSKYATIGPVPLALLGLIYYTILLILLLRGATKPGFYLVLFAVLFSLYLIYLQIFVIGFLCFFCLLSAVLTFSLFALLAYLYWSRR